MKRKNVNLLVVEILNLDGQNEKGPSAGGKAILVKTRDFGMVLPFNKIRADSKNRKSESGVCFRSFLFGSLDEGAYSYYLTEIVLIKNEFSVKIL